MTEDTASGLVGGLRSSAKAFRENTVYTEDGDPTRLGVQAAEADEAADRIEALEREREALKREAECWATEARCHKASLHQAYQHITGATGEPGNWNGARPIIEAVDALRAALPAPPSGEGSSLADIAPTLQAGRASDPEGSLMGSLDRIPTVANLPWSHKGRGVIVGANKRVLGAFEATSHAEAVVAIVNALVPATPSSPPAESQRKTASVAGLPAHVADATATDAQHSAGKED